MSILGIQAKLAALIATYGETITYTEPAPRGTLTMKAIVEVAPVQALNQLAGVKLGSGPLIATSSGTAEVYPTIALFFDPAAAVLPQVNDVWTRDGIALTFKEIYTDRLADTALVLVAICQH